MNAAATRRRDLFAFDRYDRWGLAGLCLAVAVAALAHGIVRPVVAWAGGDPLAVPYSGTVEVPALDAAGVRHGPADYDLLLDSPTTAQRMLDLLPTAMTALLVTFGCWLVLTLVRGIGAGRPFGRGTVTRLRALGGALAVGAPVLAFLQASCTGAILAAAGLPVVAGLTLPWLSVLAGLTVALIAEAFAAGTRLQDDVDGLV